MSQNTKAAKSQETLTLSEFAHDLNNLLVGIVGNAQLLAEDVQGDQLPFVEKILECAGRATDITARMQNESEKDKRHKQLRELAPAASNVRALRGVPNQIATGKDTVLVIDDEEVVRSISEAVITRAGYKALLASNGPEGIKMFEVHKDKIVCTFLDLTMPYMKGNLVYARLRAIDPELKVYVMSGYLDKQALFDFGSQEVEGFIQKPFLNEDLLQAIDEASQEVIPAFAIEVAK